MKKMSIKLKITLWFTSAMIMLALVFFTFIATITDSTISSESKGSLVSFVDNNAKEVDDDDGIIEIDDDFVSFKNGMYSLVFSESGEKISGYAPYAVAETTPFENMNVREVEADGESYLIYDRLIAFNGHHGGVWVRGIVLANTNVGTSSAMYRAMFIALPLLIILAAIGGYFIAKNALKPIKKISNTAQAIGESGNLAKRIEIASHGDELNQLAGTFNQMFAQLEQNFEAERHFTADASHELRTPVTTILAQCEYALDNVKNKQELYDVIKAIQKQGNRMTYLIESLLQFTRLEQQTGELTLTPINISELVTEICAEQKQYAEKQIMLSETIEPNIILQADAGLFRRLLENLIQNAYRYGKGAGVIQVLLISFQDKIMLSVTDDGIGIPVDKQTKIWHRFYQVEQARTTSNNKGLGLGLAMVKEITKLHHGEIEVKSTLGQGSSFIISFPKS